MHILEGVLSWQWCLLWWLVALPCLITGTYHLKKILAADREALPLLGVTGGFIFILSSLKLPSITGSCSHPTGTGLSTISFGPWITTVVCAIVLLFQSLFLAHGGLSVLGANIVSMGIIGPVSRLCALPAPPRYFRQCLPDGIPCYGSCGYVHVCDDFS